MNHRIRRTLILLAVFCLTFITVFVIRNIQNGNSLLDIITQKNPSPQAGRFTLLEDPPLSPRDIPVLTAMNSESAAIVKAVVPSVVSIDTSGIRHERLRDTLGRTWVQPRTVQGQGSGVIVTKEGHVLTNHHVIQGNPRIRLTMSDGKIYSATVVGSDPAVDIAVLKIDGKGPFPPLKIGDSSKIEVGNIVFALGNPFGLGKSLTDGKISAKKRSFSDSRVDLLQTSAAINPGNSGGPLVNILGEIIGINSRIYSSDKENPGFQGISFAIPSNAALKTMQDILARGRPIRGFLGLAFEELDPYSRGELNYKENYGILIVGIIGNSPAMNSGLQENDIIMSYQGSKIHDIPSLIKLIQQSDVNSKARIEIWREGSKRSVTATIGTVDDFNQQVLRAQEKNTKQRLTPETVKSTVGLITREPNASEKSKGIQGIIITRILTHSVLRGELLTGDNIRAINGKIIKSKADFNAQLTASVAIQNTELEVHRGTQTIRITLSPLKTP